MEWLFLIRKEDVVPVLELLAEDLGYRVRNKIIDYGLIYTGTMLRSVEVKRLSDNTVDLIVNVPYASAIEGGTKPHTPPFEHIHKWVVVKKKEVGDEAVKAAWRIIKTISKRGIRGREYVRDALEEFAWDWR
mgnify:CR=1 FL=1